AGKRVMVQTRRLIRVDVERRPGEEPLRSAMCERAAEDDRTASRVPPDDDERPLPDAGEDERGRGLPLPEVGDACRRLRVAVLPRTDHERGDDRDPREREDDGAALD